MMAPTGFVADTAVSHGRRSREVLPVRVRRVESAFTIVFTPFLTSAVEDVAT
jgi:hypothetical protein